MVSVEGILVAPSRQTRGRRTISCLTFPRDYDMSSIYMLTGLSVAHSNGSSPPTRHRRDCQSQPNPLQLTFADSVIYPQKQRRQTHCDYLSCFQQRNPEKRPFFRKEIVVHSGPKPANPLPLTSMYSAACSRIDPRQTHCSYLLLFQQVKTKKWPVFRKRQPSRVLVLSHGHSELQKPLYLPTGRKVSYLNKNRWRRMNYDQDRRRDPLGVSGA